MGSTVIGIDLGTANSCVAVVRDGRAVVLGEGNKKTIPSVFAFQDEKEVVGDVARRQLVTDPHSCVSAVKRLMGHPYESPEVQAARERVPYPIRPSPLGSVLLEIGGKDMTPVQVSARILQKIKETAEQALGHDVSRAVISVPAHFNDVQRKATKLAAEYAGLEVLRLINEPTAAAFAYGYRRGEDFTLAVYDLGGGTFDITVLMARGDSFEAIATDGDSYLGGEDFDHAMVDWLVDEFETEFGHSLKGDEAAQLRIKEAVERAKVELSEVPEARIELPFLTQLPSGDRPTLSRTISREKLAEVAGPVVERTLEICRSCLEKARVPIESLDEVLLVGGQSRMPLVRERVRNFFGREPRRDINPDEVVAMGAALFGYSLAADDLKEEAEAAAADAYAGALKETAIARKVVEGIREFEEADDLPQLRQKMQDLVSAVQELPAHRASPGPEDLPAKADANRAAERTALQRKTHPEADFPPPTGAGASALLSEVFSKFGDNNLSQPLAENPAALEELRQELSGLSAEAEQAIGRLAAEVSKEEDDTKTGIGRTAGSGMIPSENVGLDELSDQLASELNQQLSVAREQSAAAEEHLGQADEHKNARRVDLVDITSLALGVAAVGDVFTVLIDQNTPVPCEHTRTFTTNEDNQKEVEIRVRQGKAEKASQNQGLGEFILTGIPAAGRMEPKIDVCFVIDADGILAVSAKDRQAGIAQSIRVEDPLGLQQSTEEELEKMRAEAEAQAGQSAVQEESGEAKDCLAQNT